MDDYLKLEFLIFCLCDVMCFACVVLLFCAIFMLCLCWTSALFGRINKVYTTNRWHQSNLALLHCIFSSKLKMLNIVMSFGPFDSENCWAAASTVYQPISLYIYSQNQRVTNSYVQNTGEENRYGVLADTFEVYVLSALFLATCLSFGSNWQCCTFFRNCQK